MNQTVLLMLLSKCKQVILEELASGRLGLRGNTTSGTSTSTPAPDSSTTMASAATTRKTYDNAYFYILFVMFFYSFLALALFRSFVGHDKTKKDPYEEFMGSGGSATQTFSTGPSAEKFDFDEENSV